MISRNGLNNGRISTTWYNLIYMSVHLVTGSFIAGVLTFLAPCTLPLVPAYLGFISGVSTSHTRDGAGRKEARARILMNGVFYVLGFSIVFILLGTLFGLWGAALGRYRIWLTRLGGTFIILFGLSMMRAMRLPLFDLLNRFVSPRALRFIRPGNPRSSFLFGAAFAFGWSPCVGPILGAILTLAAVSGTVGQGALLLSVFSLGLAVPFLAIALGIGSAVHYVDRVSRYLEIISFLGGMVLVVLGVSLLLNNLGLWTSSFYGIFRFIRYNRLLDYL